MNHTRRVRLVRTLSAEGIFSFNFAVLLLASCAISTFGLLENNSAVIIGAMIIAPLIQPIQSLSLGALEGNVKLFRNGGATVLIGAAASVLLAGVLSLAAGIPNYGSEIVSRSKPTLIDLGIAVAAGGISAFARIRPSISSTVAGTAVAVALMPPLCVVGIAVAHGDGRLALGSSLLYATNLFGITLASMVVYQLAGLGAERTARAAIVTAAVLTTALAVPLGAGFITLLREAQIETALKQQLLANTQTFHRVDLVKTDFNWLTAPPQVTLLVRSSSPITPGQVAALEDFARFKTGRTFRLIFEVTPVVEVTGVAPAAQQ